MRPVFVAPIDPWLGMGTEEVTGDGLAIFPNPATNAFRLRSDTVAVGGAMVQLRDAMGRLVREEPWGDGVITTDGLANGLHLVRVVDNTGATLGKGRLIVQR